MCHDFKVCLNSLNSMKRPGDFMINGFSKTCYDNKCRKLNYRENTVVDREHSDQPGQMFYQSRPFALFNKIKKRISKGF